jgi:hypothetical protein
VLIILSFAVNIFIAILQSTQFSSEKVSYSIFVTIIISIILILLSFFSFLIQLIFDDDEREKVQATINKILFSINPSKKNEKEYISSDINSKINNAIKKYNFAFEIIPNKIHVQWVINKREEIKEIKNDDFIIVLDESQQQESNIVSMTKLLIKRTTLLGIRHIIGNDLQKIIDINVIKNIIIDLQNKHLIDWFFEKEYNKIVYKNEDRKKLNEKILPIDQKGLLMRIFLVELIDFSNVIAGKPATPDLLNEIEDYLEYLYHIANKDLFEEVPLPFNRSIINSSIILIAKSAKISQSADPYINKIRERIELDDKSIYLLIYRSIIEGKEYLIYPNLLMIYDYFNKKKDYKLEYNLEYNCELYNELKGHYNEVILLRRYKRV